MTLTASDFTPFFRAVHRDDPFPWQRQLAEKVADSGWPDALDLPTGSGKTACLDIAVFALACQADREPGERTAARRIFFVVDRRIVVDAAWQRAATIARALRDATSGVLRDVADHLRLLHDGPVPLLPARIRGGIARNDGWMRSATQPAIISGTVDQVGSRLLFRAYGAGLNTASMHAALVGNDSLILLDEAHCAVPFYQTASAVARYRHPAWAEEPVPSPFRLVVMSATPPREARTVWPSPPDRELALNHLELDKRLHATKHAVLAVAARPGATRRGDPGLLAVPASSDELVLDAATRAVRFAAEGRRRIGIMVNRVRTAREIAGQLRAETALETGALDADVVLLTGRMRPRDRDEIVERWNDLLGASANQPELPRPVIVVATQTLEVGADYSFDALITECASLDALRQRFGRLDRLGTVGDAPGVILIRKSQVRDEERLEKLDAGGELDDPVYGNALAHTWNWLNAVAKQEEEGGDRRLDFGIRGLDALLPGDAEERRALLAPLNAPAPDAPVLLPAHLDCWVQTAPPPVPDPDPAVFLHGPGRGEPEVSVVVRADLPEDPEQWPDIVSLAPPLSGEALQVPLRTLRAWMRGVRGGEGEEGDVEGARVEEEERESTARKQRVLVWKGRDSSRIVIEPREIRPHEVVVIPVIPAAAVLGDLTLDPGGRITDIADAVALEAGKRARLRLNAPVLDPWKAHPAVAKLLQWTDGADSAAGDRDPPDDGELSDVLGELADSARDTAGEPLPRWLVKVAAHLRDAGDRRRPVRHPGGGWIIEARKPGPVEDPLANPGEDPAAMEEDDPVLRSDEALSLEEHLEDVTAFAAVAGARCLPGHLAAVVEQAARWHDLGKADWRFQVMLHRGNAIVAAGAESLLAKSPDVPRTRSAARRARELSGLPEGWRHEMLSLQIAERASWREGEGDRDLLLHLIASHHGHARPFAPVVPDPDPEGVDLSGLSGAPEGLASAIRRGRPPAHRADSGISDRFWRLTRRYGWWGLALLEAVLRLADWSASSTNASNTTGSRPVRGAP